MTRKNPDDYKVGYRKPPERTRFKPGQSGNPKGRPKGRKNLATIMKEILARPVLVKQNGQEHRVTFSEAFVHKLMARALEGNARDMIALMRAFHDYVPEALEPEPIPHRLLIEFVGPDGTTQPFPDPNTKTG